MTRFISWVASFFSENTPQSFARLITLIVVAFILGWDTDYVVHSHLLPDPLVMAGQVAFMTCFYAVNKTAGAYTDTHTGANQPGDKSNGSQPGQQ